MTWQRRYRGVTTTVTGAPRLLARTFSNEESRAEKTRPFSTVTSYPFGVHRRGTKISVIRTVLAG